MKELKNCLCLYGLYFLLLYSN